MNNDVDKDLTGRREDEIEVTQEMIEAGALALARFDSEFYSLEEGAEDIFRTMILARDGYRFSRKERHICLWLK